MEKRIRVSLTGPWADLCNLFSSETQRCVADGLMDNPTYATFDASPDATFLEEIVNMNRDAEQRLIRFVRLFYPPTDSRQAELYMLAFSGDDEKPLNLVGDPADYYDVQVTCDACGFLTWQQRENLKLKRDLRAPVERTSNGEYVVRSEVKTAIEAAGIEGVLFREVESHSELWQLEVSSGAHVLPAPFISTSTPCETCGQSSHVSLIETNGVKYFFASCRETAVEVSHLPGVEELQHDIAASDIEFGARCLGKNSKGQTMPPPAFKGSHPLLFADRKMVALLDEQCPGAFCVTALDEDRLQGLDAYESRFAR